MARCAVKRGFFVLRDCAELAPAVCTACSRPMCPAHTSLAGSVCVECSARQEELSEDDMRRRLDDVDWWADARAPYYYRHRYYSREHYRPVNLGTLDDYYDDYDVRSFEKGETEALDAEAESPAGFPDS